MHENGVSDGDQEEQIAELEKLMFIRYEPWLLDRCFDAASPYRTGASQWIGLLGCILFSVATCFGLAIVSQLLGEAGEKNVTYVMLTMFCSIACYVSIQLVVQLIAICQLPLSVRLLLVFGTIYACCLAIYLFENESLSIGYVLFWAPCCLTGLVMRRARGWRALACGQGRAESKITILSLMDVTAAIAMTLALLSVLQSETDAGGESLFCFAIATSLLGIAGLHVWARLAGLCPIRDRADSGMGIWLSLNVVGAFFIFVIFAVSYSASPGQITF